MSLFQKSQAPPCCGELLEALWISKNQKNGNNAVSSVNKPPQLRKLQQKQRPMVKIQRRLRQQLQPRWLLQQAFRP